MKFKVFLLLVILLFSSFTYGQVEFSGSINLEAYYSNDDKLPFWFYTNQRGRISKETNVAGLINGKLHYSFSETSKLEIGAGLFYDDAFKDKVFLDELLGRVITISAVSKLAPLCRSNTRGIDAKFPATTCSSLLRTTNDRKCSNE